MKHRKKIKVPYTIIPVDPSLLRKYHKHTSEGAAPYITGVMDYTLAEIIELAGKLDQDQSNNNVISSSTIRSAIRKDKELYALFKSFY